MAYVFCRGFRLYYQEFGEGEPLILLHGNGENGDYFSNQIEIFSQRYRVITPDTRGHGKSGRGAGPLNFQVFADDLNEFMEALKLPSAHILGFSDGGNTALVFAMKYPQRVRSLILNGADLTPWGVKLTTQVPIVLGHAAFTALGLFSRTARQKSEIMNLMVNHPNLKPEQLREIQAPTLVLVGERDMIRGKHSRLIAENIPGAKMKVLPKCDHFAASKNPALFNKAVLEFLQQVNL